MIILNVYLLLAFIARQIFYSNRLQIAIDLILRIVNLHVVKRQLFKEQARPFILRKYCVLVFRILYSFLKYFDHLQ